MKRRRMFALLLAAVMTLSATSAFAADGLADAAEDAYYAEAVSWAAEKGIIDGSADAAVTRAEAVTFLWRMAGQPEPAQTETFTDVEGDADNGWYKTAVQWAVEQGVTNGTGGGNFSPAGTCTRGMILTMLYRMKGSPYDGAMAAVVPENSEDWTMEDLGNAIIRMMVENLRSEEGFTDVKKGNYDEIPIIWAMMNAVLDENQVDMEHRTVQPDAPCPRGEAVYFLYRASGDAPSPAARAFVEVGAIPETTVLDKENVKITVAGIEAEGNDVVMGLTVANGSDKTLRIDADELFVNTFSVPPQVCIPVTDEDGWTFYADAVVAAGETTECSLRLNSLDDQDIAAVYELEMKLALVEVEKVEDGYDYVGDFASGETVRIQTSLYDESISYDREGTLVYDKDGLKVLVTKAENDEYMGPQIAVYAYNGGSEEASLELAGLKLDGETFDAFFALSVPAGKRSADTVYIDFDYENIPVVTEAELTLTMLDPETWEPAVTFDPVKVTFTN